MRTLFEQRKIRAIGVNNFSKAQIKRFRNVAPPHVVQPPFNLFEREIEAELLPYCKQTRLTTLASVPRVGDLRPVPVGDRKPQSAARPEQDRRRPGATRHSNEIESSKTSVAWTRPRSRSAHAVHVAQQSTAAARWTASAPDIGISALACRSRIAEPRPAAGTSGGARRKAFELEGRGVAVSLALSSVPHCPFGSKGQPLDLDISLGSAASAKRSFLPAAT